MIIRADARQIPLVGGRVQMVCTSPPYWGLRSYLDMRQIGLEPTPEAYVASLVAVFAEVWRVLRDDGTVFLNLGDSYVSSPRGNASSDLSTSSLTNPPRQDRIARPRGATNQRNGRSNADEQLSPNCHPIIGLKPKDLVGIPWRVAFALQAAGWYLRSDIVWSKPSCMPESVRDRPTRSHEYIFLLSKRPTYYYDAAAIAEPVSAAMLMEVEQGYDGLGLKDYAVAGVQNPSSVKARIIAGAKHRQTSAQAAGHRVIDNVAAARAAGAPHDAPFGLTRNKRSVWTVNTQPTSMAHFATMPEKLVEPCILAGCPVGGLVLDPFCGSGTVLAVAERLDRRSVGCDLSYQDLAKKRTTQRGLRFSDPHDVHEGGGRGPTQHNA